MLSKDGFLDMEGTREVITSLIIALNEGHDDLDELLDGAEDASPDHPLRTRILNHSSTWLN
jgi:hypothetical protein